MSSVLRAACLAVAVAGAACAKPTLQLPTGPSEPLADAGPALEAALGACPELRSAALEIGLSGRAARQRLRGRLLAGLEAPSSIRLEAVAPFGAPVFILAASERASVLLLPRDDRVLRDAPPDQILAALAGLNVRPGELLAFLAGCPGAHPSPSSARAFGDRWISVSLENDGVAYFRRDAERWRSAAVVSRRLRVLFEEWTGDHPSRVRLQSVGVPDAASFDIVLRVSQYERNAALPPEAFTVDVPPAALPITLDELRRAGPMRDSDRDTAS